MSDVSWIKVKTDMFEDEKIRLIESEPGADSILVLWVQLLCLAGKQNADGLVSLKEGVPYTDTQLAVVLDRPVGKLRKGLEVLEAMGMIENRAENGGEIIITIWAKHQNSEGLERIRETNRLRQQRFRDQNKFE